MSRAAIRRTPPPSSHTPGELALLARRSLACVASVALLAGCGAPIEPAEDEGVRGDAVAPASFTLWIHGRAVSSPPAVGDYGDFSYWGAAEDAAGPRPRAVNWGGRERISTSNGAVRAALDCFCTGDDWCVVAAHSAGDAQIGYALAMFGDGERPVTDGVPDGSGRCGETGEEQIGWNILWVDVAGGAAGGTELADLGHWAVSDPLTGDLRTTAIRAAYDHGATQGAWVHHFAGASGGAGSALLPGQDDGVVAYHSAGGLSAPGRFCNPGDSLCSDLLRLDTAPSHVGKTLVPKWDHHATALRDDDEALDHYTHGAWAGVVGAMRDDVATYAN